MTLAQLKTLAGADAGLLAQFATVEKQIGAAIAAAVLAGDRETLERAARLAGTYRATVDAARRAGVDPDALEDALAAI